MILEVDTNGLNFFDQVWLRGAFIQEPGRIIGFKISPGKWVKAEVRWGETKTNYHYAEELTKEEPAPPADLSDYEDEIV